MTNLQITTSQLKQLCILRMYADPFPSNLEVDICDDFLDCTAQELGYVDWVDAYHRIP